KLHGDQRNEKQQEPERKKNEAAIKRPVHPGRIRRATRELSAFAQRQQSAVVAQRGGLFPEEEVNNEPDVHVNHEGSDQQVNENGDDRQAGGKHRDHRGQWDEEPKEVAEIDQQPGAEHSPVALDRRGKLGGQRSTPAAQDIIGHKLKTGSGNRPEQNDEEKHDPADRRHDNGGQRFARGEVG